MLVKHLFCSLMERLEGIENNWSAVSSPTSKEKLLSEVMELRKVSDDILDQWLLFEERMTKLQNKLQGHLPYTTGNMDAELAEMPDEVAEKIFKELMKLEDKPSKKPEMVSFLSGQAAHCFRKGQGYYSLLMYGHAVKHFQEVLEEEPELDIARLFLGFSLMMDGQWDQAEHQFHFIGKTTENRLLKATALNAQGSLLAGAEKWDQALFHFEGAIGAYPKLRDPYFNKALVQMKLRQYEEARPTWEMLAKECKDDWEVHLQLATCYQELGDDKEAEQTLTQIIQASEDPDLLWQIGLAFENLRQFGNAVVCYQLILNREPENAGAWHGMGWNLWHAEGIPVSMSYIKKAISLSPKNPDYQFSYGWILCQIQEYKEAEHIFKQILQQEGQYPLAAAGLVHVYIGLQEWHEAEKYGLQLSSDSHAPTRGLGYLQLGRVGLAKGDYIVAQKHFEQSIQESPDLKDSYLWLGLTNYALGKKEEAMRIWEYTL
ncbi:tetratricopeptide repeat protein [Ammoniphilus sp. 3BR4]|uniref:tetratricopeptide repeat protein n=1 Tax=Ammoniphilus sp. 3BR4 TaxID=3158265 RepID=UPI0034651B35